MTRVMVTGSRAFGVCPHGPKELNPPPCPLVVEHRAIMIEAFREHVTPMEFPVELIHGDAEGADRMAAEHWSRYGWGPITAFPANWDLGKGGGSARNGVLVAHMPDLVLAFHLDNSRGTADAIRQAKAAGLTVHVYPKGS